MKHKIVVRAGEIITRYTEVLPLAMLGTLTIERAAEVEWDQAQQGWTVQLINGRKLDGVWPQRQAALDAEIEAVDATL